MDESLERARAARTGQASTLRCLRRAWPQSWCRNARSPLPWSSAARAAESPAAAERRREGLARPAGVLAVRLPPAELETAAPLPAVRAAAPGYPRSVGPFA